MSKGYTVAGPRRIPPPHFLDSMYTCIGPVDNMKRDQILSHKSTPPQTPATWHTGLASVTAVPLAAVAGPVYA